MKKYNFNKNTFDKIDSAEKAYWIGFIWCDGTVIKRKRESRTSYEFKLDLKNTEVGQLEKLKEALESNHEIKFYPPTKGCFAGGEGVARLYISNNYFGKVLHEEYGMVAHRTDASKLIQKIPKEFIPDFIRGVLDADGSIVIATVENNKYNEAKTSFLSKKALIGFSTHKELIEFVLNHLIEKGLLKQRLKVTKRHEDRDGDCFSLRICGNLQCEKVLDYLYYDNCVCLERKQLRYIELKALNKSKMDKSQSQKDND